MDCATGKARRDDPPSIRLSGRSFVLAKDLPRDEQRAQRALELEIESFGGSVNSFLNAITDVLVVGQIERNHSGTLCAREQIRRGEIHRAQWGYLELTTKGSSEPRSGRGGRRRARQVEERRGIRRRLPGIRPEA